MYTTLLTSCLKISFTCYWSCPITFLRLVESYLIGFIKSVLRRKLWDFLGNSVLRLLICYVYNFYSVTLSDFCKNLYKYYVADPCLFYSPVYYPGTVSTFLHVNDLPSTMCWNMKPQVFVIKLQFWHDILWFSNKNICPISVTCIKCGVHWTLCWKIGNISGSTELFGL